ncbi:MAG: hypothetical protein NT136_00065 [Candidatus Moranbacteria bacterium]|nr:hypothetical protein [Candidatus Moranbacteria bacterium]
MFRISRFEGKPIETEEMKPQWFSIDAIPYEHMWPDDPYWLPLLLSGKNFQGNFKFGRENKILKQAVREVDKP